MKLYGETGLGLAITKQLVEMQQGNIIVESEINKGTTFNISIPYNYVKTMLPHFLQAMQKITTHF